MIEPHPWLQPVWERLCDSAGSRRFSQAVLLFGPAGMGKLQLARSLSAFLLCHDPSERSACWQCRSCRQFLETIRADREGAHPEYHEIEPEDGTHPVDSIRAIADKISLSMHSHSRRVIAVRDAECMNTHAANALLHMLEEPPPETYFVLTAADRMRIIPTVRSRLAQFVCSAPLRSPTVVQWLLGQLSDTDIDEGRLPMLLDLCCGAPLRLLEFVRENKMEQLKTFYAYLLSRREPAAFVTELSEWAGKDKLSDSLEWLLFLVQSHVLALQMGGERPYPNFPIPERWTALPPARLTGLLQALHSLAGDIEHSRGLLSRRHSYSHMLHKHALEYQRLHARL